MLCNSSASEVKQVDHEFLANLDYIVRSFPEAYIEQVGAVALPLAPHKPGVVVNACKPRRMR